MWAVAAPGTEVVEGPSRGDAHHAGGLRGHESRIGKRGQQEGLDPLRLGQRRGHSQKGLAREDDRSLGNGPDVALEAERGELREELRIDPGEGGKRRMPSICSAEKRKLEEVADRLLQPREDR